MKNLKALQRIVNEISEELGGIDNITKLRQAEGMAAEAVKNEQLMTEILSEALSLRCTADTDKSIRRFLRRAGANL